MLAGKKILLCITGSIAAYKAPLLVRLLIKEGAEVKVIMTPASTDFVSSLTLSTLSRNPVLKDLFDEESWANHVMLGRWADLMVVAPLSANSLAKMAHGLCDNLFLATYLSATCPIMVAPAMDEDMWLHPTTKQNLQAVTTWGCELLPVGFGELASGLKGEGRMAEPEEILQYITAFFTRKTDLKNRKVLITAGPTYEPLDPVRFIGNHSSGKMGYALAEECNQRGAQVTLVSGPVGDGLKLRGNIDLVSVNTADQMLEACKDRMDYDIAVMAAAVADYAPETVRKEKIKKENEDLSLSLKRTPDILRTLGLRKNASQLLVGFALETENEEKHALKKLVEKNADMIVLNSLKDEGAGFGLDTNKVTLFFKNGGSKALGLKSKKEVARDIVDSITELIK